MKKAQVTVFMIIGLIILITAGLFFYTSTRQAKEEIAPGVFVAIQNIPVELDPVSNYITQCLDDVSTRALILAGEHGGYIDLDDPELTIENFKITNNPTESDAVVFAQNSNLKIPYWWYLESNNQCTGTCVYASKRPELKQDPGSIEVQLNKFIAKELPNCLNNFDSLKQQGFEIDEKSPVEIDTKIAEDDVVFILNYELEVNKGNVTSKLEQFFVRIPVDLEKIYNLATEITNLQQKYRFLERQTMNLISSFASIDEDKLPPITDLRFEFGSTTSWKKTEVKEKIQQILSSYISLFQVYGTNNYNRELYTSSLKQKIYDAMIVPVNDVQYSNLDVTFNYLDFWPIYFDLNCNGEICEPESASSNLLSIIGIQRYNFVYDVSFPVLVEIRDEEALNGRGYKFNLFLESNIRNNEELKSDFNPLQAVQIAKTSLLCDSSNKNSADTAINVIDSISLEPLEDVGITLTVAEESCYLGKTDESGNLVTKFPTGTVGGVVSFLKSNYLTKQQLFDAKLDQESFIETKLDPINDKKIIVKKKLLEKTSQGWTFTNREADLNPKEEAFVSLTRISPLTEDEFTTTAIFQGPEQKEIRLAPGKYKLDINLLLRDTLVIPEKQIVKRTSLTGLLTGEEITIPGHEFNEQNPYLSGGLSLNVEFTEEDLKKDLIVLYAISPALNLVPVSDREFEDITQSSKIDEYSKTFASLLQPTFQ